MAENRKRWYVCDVVGYSVPGPWGGNSERPISDGQESLTKARKGRLK